MGAQGCRTRTGRACRCCYLSGLRPAGHPACLDPRSKDSRARQRAGSGKTGATAMPIPSIILSGRYAMSGSNRNDLPPQGDRYSSSVPGSPAGGGSAPCRRPGPGFAALLAASWRCRLERSLLLSLTYASSVLAAPGEHHPAGRHRRHPAAAHRRRHPHFLSAGRGHRLVTMYRFPAGPAPPPAACCRRHADLHRRLPPRGAARLLGPVQRALRTCSAAHGAGCTGFPRCAR